MTLLAYRTWRDLRAVARTHHFQFDNRWTRDQAVDHLRRCFTPRHIRHTLRQLTTRERAALRWLHQLNGRMPRHQFTRWYGSIPPYRPWHTPGCTQPWKQPGTIAEKLWYLGLIECVPGQRLIALPDAVRAELPPVVPPQPISAPPARPLDTGQIRGAVCHDVAMLLGTLRFRPARALHGRWLSRRLLALWNARNHQREDLGDCRSERQTRRLRWLHYLADVAGLIEVRAGYWQITEMAWQWLALAPDAQWQALWQAMAHDLAQDAARWTAYHLPACESRLWQLLLERLARLQPNTPYGFRAFIRDLRPHWRLEGGTPAQLVRLMRQPLTWMGVVQITDELLRHLDASLPLPVYAQLTRHTDHLTVLLPAGVPLLPCVHLTSWVQPEHGRLTLDADAVRRAVAQGNTTDTISVILTAVTGAEPPVFIRAQLDEWVRQASAITLQPVLVLT